jgi:hypothetical protein
MLPCRVRVDIHEHQRVQQWWPFVRPDDKPFVLPGRKCRRLLHNLDRRIIAEKHRSGRRAVVRQRDRRTAGVSEREPREMTAGQRHPLFTLVTLNHTQAG